jgi:molybdenum cofactor sulfurtransferase
MAGSGSEYDVFLKSYPSYRSTQVLDELRTAEYSRLDAGEHVYLDYTGGGLYAQTQLEQHQEMLRSHVFGNPHSSNPTSLAATKLVDAARAYVLKFFHASPDEYDVIFTQNASGALKLVGESYPFNPGSQYLLTFDNHNSVNGIREFAHARRAKVTYIR